MISIFSNYYEAMLLPIEIIPDDELGGFTALVPNVPGCGEGETEAKALKDLNGVYFTCPARRAASKQRACVISARIDTICEQVSGPTFGKFPVLDIARMSK